MQLNRVSTKNLVGSSRDAVLRSLYNLNGERGVERAIEVVGDREDVIVETRVIQHDVAVVRIKILIDDARPCPKRTVCIQTNGGCECGHAWNQRWVEVESPLKNVAIVNGQIVQNRETPCSIQRATLKIAEVTFRCVDARVGDVVVLRIPRIVVVCGLRPIGVVVDVGGNVRVWRPAVVIPRSWGVGTIIHRFSKKTTSPTIGETHKRHRGAIGAGDAHVQVAHVAVLHVDRDREQIVTAFQCRSVFKKVEVQLTGVAKASTIGQIRLSCHHLRRKGRPGHALHGVTIHKSRAARTHWRALNAVE